MADAFAIIGATAAILQSSQFAGKVIHTAYGLYSSASGQSETKESIEIVTTKLSGLLDTLSTDQDQSLTDLVAPCRSLGETLLELLEKSKAKKSHSLRESFKAGMNSLDKEHSGGLRGMRKPSGSEAGIKFEEILNAKNSQNQELAWLHKTLLQIKNDQELAFDSVAFLREIFSPSDVVLRRLNREKILKSLAFEGMGSRFGQVSQNERGTFFWCLEHIHVPKSHPELVISFREWLVRGRGTFHISGTPGAGKSTLMKYIVNHSDTRKYLHQWAAKRELVMANFFFWKPVKHLERSFEGLIRLIVHTILRSLPDITPIIFPQYWDLTAEYPWESALDFKIPWNKIHNAFVNLVGNHGVMKGQCFCFFIDGLDEFDDSEMQHHTKLAILLKSWTDSNMDNIKICVSSREENPFLTTFSAGQRLRLQLLMRHDIKETIAHSLYKHPNFAKNPPEDCQRFIFTMLNRAKGVFLWVKLVLNEIWLDLDEGYSLEDLHDALKYVPGELEELFLRILNSIHPKDRQEAWALIYILMSHSHHSQFDDNSDRRLSLLQYSFAKDLIGNERRINDSTILPTATQIEI